MNKHNEGKLCLSMELICMELSCVSPWEGNKHGSLKVTETSAIEFSR